MNIIEASVMPITSVEREDNLGGGLTSCDKRVFMLEGRPGLWRRVRRKGSGIKASHENSIVAVLIDNGTQLIEVARWKAMEDVLGNLLGSEE